MEPANKYEVQHLRRQVLDLKAQHAVRPVLNPSRSAYPQLLTCQLIGGQISNGVDILQYAAYGDLYSGMEESDFAYDPDTDTAYIVGLGYGVLYDTKGLQTANVLVRHSWLGFTDSFAAGYRVVVGTAYSLAVAGGGSIPVYPIIGR